MTVFFVEKLTIRNGRAICEICIPDQRQRYTTDKLVQRVVQAYPSLPNHTCINRQGTSENQNKQKSKEDSFQKDKANATFGSVIENTSVPHLLEHLVIDLQVQFHEKDHLSEDFVFTGTTEWIEKEQGKACIEVSFTDDLVVLRAFREAIDFLEQAVVE